MSLGRLIETKVNFTLSHKSISSKDERGMNFFAPISAIRSHIHPDPAEL